MANSTLLVITTEINRPEHNGLKQNSKLPREPRYKRFGAAADGRPEA